MEVNRGDKIDVTRTADITRGNEGNDALPNETPEKVDESAPSLTLSSERFTFSAFTEDENIGCIDKAGSMFKELKKEKPPTLREALEPMEYGEKTEELLKMFTKRALEKLDEIDAPGLSIEDVATIFCYTYEWDVKKFGKGIDSPYRKLNKSISVERSNPALRKTRAFLFLLLQALRKLPRYTPANKTLYRGINVHVKTEVDFEFPDRKPYAKGNEKTWWTFTSTSEDLEVTRSFVKKNKGTLFTLSGEAWGYDISVFSNFPDEKEILLEPERRLKIKSVKKEGTVIAVNAEILDTPLVLKDYIKVKPVKIKDRKSKIKEAPRNLRVEEITESTVTLLWDAPEKNGEEVLSYQVSARQKSDRFINRNSEYTYVVKKGGAKEEEPKDIARSLEEKKKDETKYTVRNLEEGREYEFRVRCKYKDGWGKEWSEKVVPLSWKKCPDDVNDSRKYSVDGRNPRIATRNNYDGLCDCTIIGNTYISPNTVTSWSIKILKSEYNNGDGIHIGVAPSDINQGNNYEKCGWHFNCYYSSLSRFHDCGGTEYGPKKGGGEYVHTGDSVGVVVDITKGYLSFALNGVNLGAAYNIPLDKPLVPCVILAHPGDSVELDTSEVKEDVDSSIPVPSNITAKNITWASITLAWDKVEGASFYQIEVNGSISGDATTENKLTWERFLPETEHSFRVRTVRGSSVSEWSYAVEGRTLRAYDGVWKECPDDVNDDRKYSVDEKNPRVASKVNSGTRDGSCTIIGNTLIPLNKVIQWNIKVLKSRNNNGNRIYIGVAPFDMNHNGYCNYNKCGWYFYCYDSTLCSGPPHNYSWKEYGPRKDRNGQYVHTGDSVGVVMDTAKEELSFVLNGVNRGVAYEGIPLDKPLVPCIILYYQGDSVELIV